MPTKTVLVIDTDPGVYNEIRRGPEAKDYEVRVANSGSSGLEWFGRIAPDIVILDANTADIDAHDIFDAVAKKDGTPVIIAAKQRSEVDAVSWLNYGADDYISVPFGAKEFFARINAVLRRYNNSKRKNENILVFDKLEINMDEYTLRVDGVKTSIPRRELELLHYLASNYNRVFKRDELLDKIWGYDFWGGSRTVDVHIKRLREKLNGVSDKWSITTVWSVGYKFELIE
ncbi:MAG: response regulator transcription factor [Clostridia bacterium]|nr:response regulator transcription factor [Clostridia bacterium]